MPEATQPARHSTAEGAFAPTHLVSDQLTGNNPISRIFMSGNGGFMGGNGISMSSANIFIGGVGIFICGDAIFMSGDGISIGGNGIAIGIFMSGVGLLPLDNDSPGLAGADSMTLPDLQQV